MAKQNVERIVFINLERMKGTSVIVNQVERLEKLGSGNTAQDSQLQLPFLNQPSHKIMPVPARTVKSSGESMLEQRSLAAAEQQVLECFKEEQYHDGAN